MYVYMHEAFLCHIETYYMTKKTYYMTKETYYMTCGLPVSRVRVDYLFLMCS